MTIGSLFSGIAGLELGLERAGLGPVLWQVERDPFRRAILRRHFPHAELHHDVRTVGRSQLAPVDLICGGFPCRGTSAAGKKTGPAHPESALWFEFLRIVGELLPAWVVVENVGGGASRWVDEIRGDLERAGYESLPIPLSARDVGAPHFRPRVFVLGRRAADAHEDSEPPRPRRPEMALASSPPPPADAHPVELRDEPGRAGRAGRAGRGSLPGIPKHDGALGGWDAEPPLLRVAHGLPDRMDRIAALGDAVVPTCAEVVGWIIRELTDQ